VLGQVGGRQRDGHPAVRPVEAGVAEGRADAVAGLQDGGVAEPHHGDRRQAAADVDLDADGVGDEADQRGGRQPGQHGQKAPSLRSTTGRWPRGLNITLNRPGPPSDQCFPCDQAA
jgi:hypothetical protein